MFALQDPITESREEESPSEETPNLVDGDKVKDVCPIEESGPNPASTGGETVDIQTKSENNCERNEDQNQAAKTQEETRVGCKSTGDDARETNGNEREPPATGNQKEDKEKIRDKTGNTKGKTEAGATSLSRPSVQAPRQRGARPSTRREAMAKFQQDQ